ncbi:hypothetical protein APHAL10511_006642 [Amanita phalloides]|nr:hypothetical protein APHAL10511_006642 [Amanita phalloides]
MLRGLQKAQEYIQNLLGNPTREVSTYSGNIFHINDVGAAIAKDFANPITCFAMQEYLEDLGQSMLEVYHGQKMLFELSSDIRPPTVKLSTGEYFIPKCFFFSKVPNANTSELNVQGFMVCPQENIFYIEKESMTIPISNFSNTFEDLQDKLGSDIHFINFRSDIFSQYAKLSPHKGKWSHGLLRPLNHFS